MLTEIVVHVLPKEIDWFEWQSKQLKESSSVLSNDNILVNVTLNLNLVDWENSKIPKEFFIKKFYQIKNLYDWCKTEFIIDDYNECLGCNDKRRSSIRNSKADNILYLDCDIIFNKYTLRYIIESAKIIKNEYYIISPEIVRLWDTSWDVLVNENYKNHPLGFYKTFDPYEILSYDISNIFINNINEFKFGGGWFNLFSTNLLKLIDIPDSLGSYGLDDSFIMAGSMILKNNGYDIKQYVIKNLIIAENIKYRHEPYSDILLEINKKDEFRNFSNKNFKNELLNFTGRLKNI